MLDRIDEKGKVFTERIRKDHVEVEIVTTQGRVHGYVHVMPHQRVKDLLNMPAEHFLAVTNATMGEAKDDTATRHDFITINKQYIITVVPINEPRPAPRGDEYIAY
jgi:hypothetical protein